MNNMWQSAVVDFGRVSSKILWIKFKFPKVTLCVAVGYGLNKGDDEGRDRFWNNMDKTLDSIGNGYRLCILRDLNAWIEKGQELT